MLVFFLSRIRLYFASGLAICLATCVAFAQDVTTYHNNNARTGLYKETTLTTGNVNSAGFGLLFNTTLDVSVDAQPLYLSYVSIPCQGTRNVLYVVTENDSVYALDAKTGVVLWQKSMLLSGEAPSDDHGCTQISPQIGVTSTPVIDRSSGPR